MDRIHIRGGAPLNGVPYDPSQIDFFAVYCPETCGVYLIPIADLPVDSGASLRVDPPRNNQRKRVRLAVDYQFARVTTEGLRASSGA